MPIERYGEDEIRFDPDLPPGNPLVVPDQPFPTEFRLHSATFNFSAGRGSPEFFQARRMFTHGGTLKLWLRLLLGLAPLEHMVEVSWETTLSDALDETLHNDTTYTDVNAAYRTSRLPVFDLDPEQSAALLEISHHSIRTAEALNLITRSASKPDFHLSAFACNTLEALRNPLQREMLVVGEMKQLLAEIAEIKHKAWLIGLSCQCLRYLAYANRIFGTKFALAIYGHFFRRCIMLDGGILLMDLGPFGAHLDPGVAIDMTLHELLLYGTGAEADPMAVYHELRPDSTFDDQGAGSALSSFLTLAGQTWIDDNRGIEQAPLVLTGRRYARVQNFSVETLAVAASSVRAYLEGLHEDDGGSEGGGAGGGDGEQEDDNENMNDNYYNYQDDDEEDVNDDEEELDDDGDDDYVMTSGESDGDRLNPDSAGDPFNRDRVPVNTGSRYYKSIDDASSQGVPALIASDSTSSGLTANSFPSFTSIASKPDPDDVRIRSTSSSSDPMREELMRIVENKDEYLTSLYRPDEPGFTKAQQAHLRALGKAAREGGLDMQKEFNF